MPHVFISYRHADAGRYAARLHRALARSLGPREVFLDKHGIDPGESFPERLVEALTDSDIVAIVIGPQWTRARTRAGRLRLHEPDDWVRREIQLALRIRIPVIPVLAGGAVMPASKDLPPLLRRLTFRQAIDASGRTLKDVADAIVARLPRLTVEFDLDDDEAPAEADAGSVSAYWIGVSVQNRPPWVSRIKYELSEEHSDRVCHPENSAWTTTYGDFRVGATMYDDVPSRAGRERSVRKVLVSDALKARHGKDASEAVRQAIRDIKAG